MRFVVYVAYIRVRSSSESALVFPMRQILRYYAFIFIVLEFAMNVSVRLERKLPLFTLARACQGSLTDGRELCLTVSLNLRHCDRFPPIQFLLVEFQRPSRVLRTVELIISPPQENCIQACDVVQLDGIAIRA